MARQKDTKTHDMFTKGGPKMPEGYYCGDKPNPNLRDFVEKHLSENPFDPAKDTYQVLAFAKKIDATKATAIYNMHTYWSKKPHDAICQYIRHYTQPKDLVLDPFCGSGGTALAALMEGRKAIAMDRSPAATFITKNYCTPVDLGELRAAFKELECKVRPELDWLYETRCHITDKPVQTDFTVYSQVFQCPRCLDKIALFDCIEAQGVTLQGKPKTINICPHCHKKGFTEEIRSQSQKFGAIPVLVSYSYLDEGRWVQVERRHNDADNRAREYFERFDLGKLREIESTAIPHWFPAGASMTGFSRYQRDALRLYGIREAADMFTKRNLWALAAIRNALSTMGSIADPLLFGFEAILINLSRMQGYSTDPRFPNNLFKGTYYIPQVGKEYSVLPWYGGKIENLLRGYAKINELLQGELGVMISTANAADPWPVPSDSVDYIFTDPPYAEKVQYGELNFVWESWMGFEANWLGEEIIVNETRNKSEADWAAKMLLAMRQAYRVLKPGRWLSLCYHDTAEGTWQLVQDIMEEAGFVADNTVDANYIDAKQKSRNQLTADKVTKRDLVINFRKPKAGECRSKVHFTGEESRQTFREKAQAVIREFLQANPGATKDRIYDELVSSLVRKGQMEAHNFEELLRQVADEVKQPVKRTLFENEEPDLLGSHEISRWHLKESEVGGEEAEQATGAAAAAKIHEFLAKTTAQKVRNSDQTLFDLEAALPRKRTALQAVDEGKSEESGPKLAREIRELTEKLERLKAERAEWQQQALHYSEILEFYHYVQPKPRSTLEELLADYCYQTDQGNWRPPSTEDEKKEKTGERQRAVRRQIQRLFNLLESGGTIPPEVRPDDATLADWIRHCKRTGLYAQGKLLYERAGLNLNRLSEQEQANVEEDYQVCAKGWSQQNTPKRPASNQQDMKL
jgi:DNA modification methylase